MSGWCPRPGPQTGGSGYLSRRRRRSACRRSGHRTARTRWPPGAAAVRGRGRRPAGRRRRSSWLRGSAVSPVHDSVGPTGHPGPSAPLLTSPANPASPLRWPRAIAMDARPVPRPGIHIRALGQPRRASDDQGDQVGGDLGRVDHRVERDHLDMALAELVLGLVLPRALLVGLQGGVVLRPVADDRDHEDPLGGGLLQDRLEVHPVIGLAVGEHDDFHDRLLVGVAVAELLVVVRERRLPGGHDVGPATPGDGVEPALQIRGVRVADLDVLVGEPVRHQAAALVAAARLLGRGLGVLGLQGPHETVQRADDDGPAAALVWPVRAVLVGVAPVHAGRQVEQEDGLLLAVGRDGRPDLAARSPARAAGLLASAWLRGFAELRDSAGMRDSAWLRESAELAWLRESAGPRREWLSHCASPSMSPVQNPGHNGPNLARSNAWNVLTRVFLTDCSAASVRRPRAPGTKGRPSSATCPGYRRCAPPAGFEPALTAPEGARNQGSDLH